MIFPFGELHFTPICIHYILQVRKRHLDQFQFQALCVCVGGVIRPLPEPPFLCPKVLREKVESLEGIPSGAQGGGSHQEEHPQAALNPSP